MLKIKLARFGKRNQPHFRIVVNEARDKRDGSYVEMIGHYAPTQTPKLLEIDLKKYDSWIAKGAKPTDTVAYLYEVAKSGEGFPEKKMKPSKKQLAKQKAEKEVEKEDKKEAKKEDKPAAKEKEKSTAEEVKQEEPKQDVKKDEKKEDSKEAPKQEAKEKEEEKSEKKADK